MENVGKKRSPIAIVNSVNLSTTIKSCSLPFTDSVR